MIQDDKEFRSTVKDLLASLSASSAMLIQGDGFAAAGKHAEALKSLANAWELLRKMVANDWTQYLGDKERNLVHQACKATHETAATLKVT